MRVRLAVLVATAIASSTLPARAATEPRTRVVHLLVDGRARTYRLHRPAKTTTALALVVVLHGAGATGSEVERRYHWDPLADHEDFVVAYPQALDRRWQDTGVVDSDFLRALLDDVARRA